MLVEQAAKSFHIWTGKRPESRAVIENIRGKLPG
jgi:shikimate 5-dehydrogenase